MTIREQAAQLVMLGINDDLDAGERAALDRTPFGSVLLLGRQNEGTSVLAERVATITGGAGPAGIIVAVDQEGGKVQRISGPGFDTIPPAVDQAELSPAELTAAATRWGDQLAEAGIWLNLAPVADTVPADRVRTNQPIGVLERGYGSDPDQVAVQVTAFIEGMHAAGVGTSAKHFPNLGDVVGNTDVTGGVSEAVTDAESPALEPFRAAIASGTDTVMVSTATYELLDPSRRAAFSPRVIRLLRDTLAYDGVIISDDLGAAASVSDVPGGERAVRFISAGGDLAISADPGIAEDMVAELVAAVDEKPAIADQIAASALRVVQMKRDRGLTTCVAG
ncbi:MAG: glycoside hydrolase family 3 N-terminal domain-containing protein [Propioniciclava sp.]